MATSPLDLGSLQASDYTVSDIGLQDYPQLPNAGLDAPTVDTPLGVDPFSGSSLYDGDPTNPSLTTIGNPAGGGTNLYNDGLLPLSNPNPVSDAVVAQSQYSGVGFATDTNLPLTPANSSIDTQLGSNATTKGSTAMALPLGGSLWAALFGTASGAAVGAAKGGTAGTPSNSSKVAGLAGIKGAPPASLTNPISATSTALIIGVIASIIGIIIWSFSGGR